MDITYDRISGSLGSLLLVWAAVEKSVRDEITCFHGFLPARTHGIAAALRTWEGAVVKAQRAASLGPLLATALRGQLRGPLAIRNGLCHGLVGISAANEQVAAALHWEINGEKHSIYWKDLQEQLAWLSRLPRAIAIISESSLERPGSRVTDTDENREWWRSEFSLHLSDL